MERSQGRSAPALEARRVGGLPLVNEILRRLKVDRLLAKVLPSGGRVSAARALGVLVRNIVLNDRQPLYTHTEWATRAEPGLIGLTPDQVSFLNDDRVGRALDRLFDADRAALLTELVRGAIREFAIELDQLHNDSTTLTLMGEYKGAGGREVRGKPTVLVTYGHNKDDRPDLKQLLFVLTVSADGAVPIHYRALDGNTNDSTTHVGTWETLRRLCRRSTFPYVADCKLCSKTTLAHIDKHRGRFITVLPRNRREDKWFRSYIQTHDPPWVEAVRRPNPRRRSGPEDVWKVVEVELPSNEGYRIVWVWNSLTAAQDAEARGARIEKAYVGIERLQTKLRGKRCRLRLRERLRFSVAARIKDDVVAADERSDGMFPLITNCKDLSLKAILEAYKFRPKLEKRHEQLESVQDLAPVRLKNVSRIEALLFLYFVALLVHALLEREVRRGMARENSTDYRSIRCSSPSSTSYTGKSFG